MKIEEFKKVLPKHRAIIGFDYGSRRMGVAVSDLLCTIASSYGIIQRTSLAKDFVEIERIIEEKEVGGIVYGLPLQMNGEEGELAQEVRAFALKVFEKNGLPYTFWDERLSSSAMERFLIKEIDMSRKKRKETLDAVAAVFILQGALDRLSYLSE